MGLFDALNSYEGQQALGLLAAAGGRSDGAGFGQRMIEGLGQGEKWKAAQQAKALQDLQMQNYLSEIKKRDADVALAQNKQDRLAKMTQGLLGGGITDATQSGAPASAALGATAQRRGLQGVPIEEIAALQIAGGPDLMKAWEAANVGSNVAAGSYRIRPGQEPEYFTKPESGIQYKNGAISPIQGADALSDIEARKTIATEAAKAPFDLIDVPTGVGNQTVKMSRAQYLQQSQGGQQAAPQSIPGSGLDMSRVTATQMLEMAKNDPEGFNSGAMQRGIQRFQGTPQTAPQSFRPTTLGMTEDPQAAEDRKVEQERRSTLAKESTSLGVKKIYEGYDNARNAVEALNTIGESRKAIAGGAYGGTGAELKLNLAKGLQAFGFNVDPEKVTNTDYLQSNVGEGILAKAKTLGANPTDNDARIIRSIVGSIGTDPQALNKLLDKQEEIFSRAIESHNKNYQSAMKSGFNSPYDMTVDRPQVQPAVNMNIPREAINMLKMNPRLRADFESKYGVGSAASVLGQ